MKCHIILIISLLAFIAVGNAQNEPSVAPTRFDLDSDLFDDSNSTAPSESPSDDNQSPSPTTAPDPSDCAGQTCDIDDPDACNCRPGLECRSRIFGQYFCSQVSRRRRDRLSAALGFGGAGGRQKLRLP
jgi:hypothetical protein